MGTSDSSSHPSPAHPVQMPAHSGRMPDHTWRTPAHQGQKTVPTGTRSLHNTGSLNAVPSSSSLPSVASGPSHSSTSLDGVFMFLDPPVNLLNCDPYSVYNHLNFHGLQSQGWSVKRCRQSLIYHILNGGCATRDPNGNKVFSYLHGCHNLSQRFDSPAAMSYAARSALLSSTTPHSDLAVVGGSIGLSDAMSDADSLRSALVQKRSELI
jgi:hypothetical protein